MSTGLLGCLQQEAALNVFLRSPQVIPGAPLEEALAATLDDDDDDLLDGAGEGLLDAACAHPITLAKTKYLNIVIRSV